MLTLSEGPHATWSPVELRLSAAERPPNPYTNVAVDATFEHESGETYEVPSFWDGGREWRVRFAPPREGTWRFETEVDLDAGTDGLAVDGEFEAVPYAGDNPIKEHGFLRTADDERSFEHADGTSFFWLADTAWPAGAKATPEEWERYLDKRTAQGYNVVQVNTLPQWDASRPRGRYPFGEEWDYDSPNPGYFQALDDLVGATHERGVVPALVAVWRNYVEEDVDPTYPKTFKPEQAGRFGRYLGARYGAYGATWFVSGDSKLPDEALPVYDSVAKALRESVTHPLFTVHMVSSITTSDAVNDRDWLDYHLYQSGHHASDRQYNAYRYAVESRAFDPDRPVVNGEPCYERHGYFEEPEIRVSREAVRRAGWWSVLGGASAGLTYGAHGIWHWHRQGEHVPHAEDRAMPEPWCEAISYPGADDYAFLKAIVKRFEFGSLEPRQEALVGAPESVRAAEFPQDDSLLAYAPEAKTLEVDTAAVGFQPAEFLWLDPKTGRRQSARSDGTDVVTISPPDWDGDALLWCRAGN